jgi:hypothetical protein
MKPSYYIIERNVWRKEPVTGSQPTTDGLTCVASTTSVQAAEAAFRLLSGSSPGSAE